MSWPFLPLNTISTTNICNSYFLAVKKKGSCCFRQATWFYKFLDCQLLNLTWIWPDSLACNLLKTRPNLWFIFDQHYRVLYNIYYIKFLISLLLSRMNSIILNSKSQHKKRNCYLVFKACHELSLTLFNTFQLSE